MIFIKPKEFVRNLEEGRKMKALNLYREKRISLGLGAKLSNLSLSEFIDLLETHNVPLNLSVEDARKAMENAKKEF